MLTFLGLMAAVYAIIPAVARLRLRLQFGPQLVLGLIAFVLALYFEFFHLIGQPCPENTRAICGWLEMPKDSSFTPQMAAFLVVLVWMVLAVAIATYLPATQRSLRPIADLLEELFHRQRYGEAIDFISPQLAFVENAADRKLWRQRVYDWLQTKREFYLDDWLEGAVDARKTAVRPLRKVLSPFRAIFPSPDRAQEEADRILNTLYLSSEFRRYLAVFRPRFAGRLLSSKTRQRFTFSDQFLSDLISDRGSRLYEELQRNATYDGPGDNLVVRHNFILQGYFSNAGIAESTQAWKPVGDFALSWIRDENHDILNRLNSKVEDFDVEKWVNPVAVAIVYFDLMVRSAVAQNVESDMWLGYLDHFVYELVAGYDATGANIDPDDEFPTLAARLIYESIDWLGHWIHLARHAKPGSLHSRFSNSPHLDGAGIPSSAARSLGTCLRYVLTSTKIGDTFASYMLECVVRDIKSLAQATEKDARRYLIESIVSGGGYRHDCQYGKRLATLLHAVDYALRVDVEDFIAAAKERYSDEDFP
ncbi:hypothetical protein [Agrobacterium rosae]|uniref:hypothetical protein n=1 Tax=Agrobacterium rosae TaxID=1972867 RepID=UPI0011777BE3|nr:hypothetical protein [Agrobacterium rosae]